MNLRIFFVVSSILLASVGVHAQKKKILFDAAHGQDLTIDCKAEQEVPPNQKEITPSTPETFWSGALSAMAVDLVNKGFEVESLPIGSSVTWGKNNEQGLEKYAVFVIIEPKSIGQTANPFSTDEISAIRNFVSNGGGLFMIADHAVKVPWDPARVFNDLMGSQSGIIFNNHSSDPLGSFDDPLDSIFTSKKSPIISDGLIGSPTRGLRLSGSTSMTISGSAIGHIWHTGTTKTDSTGVTFATSTFGNGRVAAVGDSGIAADGTSNCNAATIAGYYRDETSDNAMIILNAVMWLAQEKRKTALKVVITAPVNGAKASGDVTITATASDVDVTKVEFFVDGTLAKTVPASPYKWRWDSTSVKNGDHDLFAKAYDASGNVVTSSPVKVTTGNFGGSHWKRWIVITLVLILAVVFLWRPVFARIPVRVELAPNTPDETFLFNVESLLPCRVSVEWRSDPAAVTAILHDHNGIPTSFSDPIRELNLPRGKQHISVVFSVTPSLTPQPIKVSVEMVASPRFVKWRLRTTLKVSRQLSAVSGTVSPENIAKSPEPKQLTTHTNLIGDEPGRDTLEPIDLLYDEDDIERAVIDVVNGLIGPDGADRARLRALLRDHGVGATIATPFKIPESVNAVFRKYWFKPDDRAGSWLWVALNGDSLFIVIPFDLRSFNRSSMLSYLSSLYEGVMRPQKSLAESAVRFSSTARVARGDGDSYRIVRRGSLTIPSNSKAFPGATGWTVDSDERNDPSILRFQQLENRVESAIRQLTKLEEVRGHADQRMSHLEEQVARLGTTIHALLRREAIEQPERTAPLRTNSAVPTVQDTTTSVDQSGIDQPAEPTLPTKPARLVVESDTQTFVFAPAPVAAPDQVIAPATLPSGWEQRLSRARGDSTFIEPSAYARALKKAYQELSPLETRNVKVIVVHLLPAVRGSDTFYEVHSDDTVIEENGMIAFRCSDNPSAPTPAQQFFIAFKDPGERLSVVCPPGEYSPVSFDYTTLIQNVPTAPFTIEEVQQPARLERDGENRYRVVVQMIVTLA